MDLSKFGYDFTEKYIDIFNHKMHFIDEGKGEPVLMLHGNPSWSFYYRDLIHFLKNQYRILVPDHIGCGLSDKPPMTQYSYTLKQRLLDLSEFLTLNKIDKDITLVLHDWGGMIGMAYAIRNPEKIKRIIIFNTAAFHLPASKPFPFLLKFARSKIGSWLILNCNAFARGAAWIGCQKKRMPKLLRDAYCFPYDSPKNRVALLQFVKDIPLQKQDVSYDLVTEVQDNLKRLDHLPMLICWGMKDKIFDYHFLAEWEKYFPHASVHRFPDAGHYVIEEEMDSIIGLLNIFLPPMTKKR